MKRFEAFAEKFLVPIADRISRNKEINAVKDGMVQILPLLLIGSIVLVITNFPYIEKILPGVDLWGIFGKGYEATMGIAALVGAFTFAYNYAISLGSNGVYGGITSVAAYFLVTDFAVTTDTGSVYGIPVAALGAKALFTVILVALVSVRIYVFFEKKNIVIRMPESVPANISKSFSSILPMLFVTFAMLAIRSGLAATSFGNLQNFVFTIITTPLLGLANLPFFIVVMNMMIMVFWFFGLHGGLLSTAIFGPVLTTMTLANADAFANGEKIPYITSQVFNNTYGTLAAAGVLAAVVAAMIVGRSKRTKAVSRLSIVPAIFGIQEPFHFGFPTFLNPITLIPYVFVPAITAFIGYTLIQLGIAPQPVIDVPWTTPILIQGFISTNYNIMGALVQLFLFAISVLMYIPFIRIVDKTYLKEEAENDSVK